MRSTIESNEVYTKEERERMLESMSNLSDAFYWRAVNIRCHPFIEFTGFMNEWIKMARKAQAMDMDFSQLNTHSNGVLPMDPAEAAYIAEKFDCIFGPALRSDPRLMQIFMNKLQNG